MYVIQKVLNVVGVIFIIVQLHGRPMGRGVHVLREGTVRVLALENVTGVDDARGSPLAFSPTKLTIADVATGDNIGPSNHTSWAFATLLTAGHLKAQEKQGVDRDYVSMTGILGIQLAQYYPGIKRILIVQKGRVVEPDLSALRKSGWEILERPYILPKFFEARKISTSRMGMYKDQFMKLHLWKETQYRRIVFIDADTMLMRHVDFSATIQSDKLVACPTTWTTKRSDGKPHSFNGAIFVLTPSSDMYEQMIENNVTPAHFKKTGAMTDFDLNEMGTLNHFFPDWIVPPDEFHGICTGPWFCCTGVETKCPTGGPPITSRDAIGLVHGAKSFNHLLNFAPGGKKSWKSARDCLTPLATAREQMNKKFNGV